MTPFSDTAAVTTNLDTKLLGASHEKCRRYSAESLIRDTSEPT